MTAKELLKTDAEDLKNTLLTWYQKHKRTMPWRKTSDPYAILVSEIMLQQTQVSTVIPYYERFLAAFPTPQALAEAEESSVLKMWEGLGYYRRARFLQEAARQICKRFEGSFPQVKGDIDSLKGVGAYTSAAVASIAFGLPYACVDGNVIRVITRLAAIDSDVSVAGTQKAVAILAQYLLNESHPGDHNQAMMELGATVCTPRNPTCLTCPISHHCQTKIQGDDPHERPFKSAKVKIKSQTMELACFLHGNQVLLGKRPPQGLMADMWEFPTKSTEGFSSWETLFETSCHKIWTRPKPFVKKFTHLHVNYHVTVWALKTFEEAKNLLDFYVDLRWMTQEETKNHPLSQVSQKLFKEFKPFMESPHQWKHSQSNLPGMSLTP